MTRDVAWDDLHDPLAEVVANVTYALAVLGASPGPGELAELRVALLETRAGAERIREAARELQRRIDAPVARPPAIAERPAPRRGILVVDDDRAVGRSIARVLRSQGAVDLVHSAREALELLERGSDYKLILCDLMMPEVSGADLYRALQRRLPAVVDKIVFMTGGIFSDRIRGFLDSVDNLVLDKPLDFDRLHALVEAR